MFLLVCPAICALVQNEAVAALLPKIYIGELCKENPYKFGMKYAVITMAV
jgi:hypothetical protein